MGTTTSSFRFAGDCQAQTLPFNILRTTIHDIVIASLFLRLTETLTRLAHRIQHRLRDVFTYHVCALDPQQHVSGRLNGAPIKNAVPDTGADVSMLSLALAKRQGLKVNTSEEHRVLLEFADGSTGRTVGIVRDVDGATTRPESFIVLMRT